MNKDNQRIIWIDNLKVIACFFVVLGHFFQGIMKAGIIEDSFTIRCFLRIIYYFHVQIFFVCSGYLYQKKECVNSIGAWKNHICKKALSLGVPYFFFTVITWIIKNVFSSSVNDSTGGLLQAIFIEPISPYWYLYSLFLIFCVTTTVRKKKNYIVLLVVALVMLIINSCDFLTIPRMIYYIIGNEIWFVVGIGCAVFLPEKPDELYTVRTAVCSIIGISIFIVSSILIYASDFHNEIISVGLRGISVFSIFFLVRSMFGRQTQSRLGGYFAKYILPIFLMHTIFAAGIRIVLLKIGVESVVVHCLFGIIGSFVGPIIVSELLGEIKYGDFCIYPLKYINR